GRGGRSSRCRPRRVRTPWGRPPAATAPRWPGRRKGRDCSGTTGRDPSGPWPGGRSRPDPALSPCAEPIASTMDTIRWLEVRPGRNCLVPEAPVGQLRDTDSVAATLSPHDLGVDT